MYVLTNFEVTQQFLVASLNMLEVCRPCVQLIQQFLGASFNMLEVCRQCVQLIQQFLGASLNMLEVCRPCELLEAAKVQLCIGLLYIMLKLATAYL